MIAALLVVWDGDARSLKLGCPLRDAMFTTVPRLVRRCGHAALVRYMTRSTSSLRAASHSASVVSSSQLKCVLAARLKTTSIRPYWLTARSTSFVHSLGSFRRHGCSETISPPAAW